MHPELGGSMVAIVTPMKADGELDYAGLERLVEWHIEQGTDAIVATGTTGESPTLASREHVEYLVRIKEIIGGRVPLVAGTGSNATAQTRALTRKAAEIGVDACLLVVPYYNKPTQEGLYQHFRTIAESVDVPQILYNVPSRTVVDLLPATVARLATLDNVVAIKDASSDIDRVATLRGSCGDDFGLFSGEDGTATEFMLAGGDGVITVTGNVAPRLMHELCEVATAGDREQAETLDRQLALLQKALFVETNPIPAKWALSEMGLIEPGIRLPLVELSHEHHETVRDALNSLDLL